MLMIRPWRLSKGLSRRTLGRLRATPGADATSRLPRVRMTLIWRRPRRFTQAFAAPSRAQPLVLDVRHRLDLLLHWTSSMKSFSERLVRSVQGIAPPRPQRRQEIVARGIRHAALQLLVRERRAGTGQAGHVASSTPRVAGLKQGPDAYIRLAARPARYFARDAVHRRVPGAISLGGTRQRGVPGAAQAFPALKRAVATHAHDPLSHPRLFRRANDLPVNDPPLQGSAPRPPLARLFAVAGTRPPARLFAAAGTQPPAGNRPGTYAKAPPARNPRPVELAWRNSAAVSPASPEDRTSFPHSFTAAVKRAGTGEVNPSIDMRRGSARHQTAVDSDQRSVNRLADEVLGRIERKLRIERERRGH